MSEGFIQDLDLEVGDFVECTYSWMGNFIEGASYKIVSGSSSSYTRAQIGIGFNSKSEFKKLGTSTSNFVNFMRRVEGV